MIHGLDTGFLVAMLGRKRLLDTLRAVTYRQAGIQSLLTINQSDFLVFGVFTCVAPGGSGTNP